MSDAAAEIDIPSLQRLQAQGEAVTIVDVRDAWELEICALAGSVSIPLEEFQARVGELPATGAIVLLCHHGMRSLNAAMWLRSRGNARAVSLSGGIDAWAQAADPAMRRY